MKRRELASTILAATIGIVGMLLLSAWSVCEQDDRECVVAWVKP